MGDQTWVEAWQGASADGCAAPVAPHDGAGTYSFVHDQSTNTVTLIGKGSFIGIPKATNNGELSSNDNVPVTRKRFRAASANKKNASALQARRYQSSVSRSPEGGAAAAPAQNVRDLGVK